MLLFPDGNGETLQFSYKLTPLSSVRGLVSQCRNKGKGREQSPVAPGRGQALPSPWEI